MSTIQRDDSGRPHPVIDATHLAPNDGQKFKSVKKKVDIETTTIWFESTTKKELD